MSRGIKFRAWDKDLKKYVFISETIDGEFWINNGISSEEMPLHRGAFEQYTGLKDKNGKEIYVGDILGTCCGKAEVYFDDELLMYRVKVRHGGTMPLVSKKSKRHFDYEVIGNIHENLELVEVK